MSASASRCARQLSIGHRVTTSACTPPPTEQSRAWPSAADIETGSCTTTIITASVLAATTPAVGLTAQAMPAPNAQSASSTGNAPGMPTAT